MKAFLKKRKKLCMVVLICALVIAYACAELNALPEVYQRIFLPDGQTAAQQSGSGETAQNAASSDGTAESGKKPNQYLRDLMDKRAVTDAALTGSCSPTTLYAVAQPTGIAGKKQNRSVSARLVGVDENYLELEPFSLYGGRFFYPDEYLYGQRVTLIDEQLAVALFQYAEPLLEELTIGGQTYRIIGIIRDHKQVGDQMEYSAYVPYRSLIASSLTLSALVYEARPIKGAGGWAAFTSAAASLGDIGTTVSLNKERMNAKMPLRLLAVLCGGAVAFTGMKALSSMLRRLLKRYRQRLRGEYASQLIGWLVLRLAALLAGYGLCILALIRLFVLLVEPVFTFPEWVPAILVEPKDIAAAFWNVWQTPAAVAELRTPQLLRIRFYRELLGWICGLCGVALGILWGAVREWGAQAAERKKGQDGLVSTEKEEE